MIDVGPGTVVLFSDIGCPWANLAVHRLHRARTELGLDGQLVVDHRAFPLEVLNRQPTPKRTLDAEIPVTGGLEPDAGWKMWQGDPSTWPVTTLPALEAVQAAKAQGLEASERLDRRLRAALFAESRCISLRHVILEVADEAGLDCPALAEALDDGRARAAVMAHAGTAEGDEVKGSPHLFLPDGSSAHNPGIRLHWEGEHDEGFPVVDSDDPGIYAELLRRAAGPTPAR